MQRQNCHLLRAERTGRIPKNGAQKRAIRDTLLMQIRIIYNELISWAQGE